MKFKHSTKSNANNPHVFGAIQIFNKRRERRPRRSAPCGANTLLRLRTIPPNAWSEKNKKSCVLSIADNTLFFTHGVRILLETFETTLQEQVDLFAHRRSRSLRLCFVRQQTVRQVQRQRFRQGFGVGCFPKRALQVHSKVDRR